MLRIILFLIFIALAAYGVTEVAELPGEVTLSWGAGERIVATFPVVALALGLVAVAAIIAWIIVSEIWRTPARLRRRRHEKRQVRGRRAITHGLLAIGHGDAPAARRHAEAARRHAPNDPLALLLHAQSAQLEGNRDQAQRAFRAMAERGDTRLLGLRGLFIEAQRADDATAAAMIAEEAIRLSPSSTWASQAVLGFRCARGDWSGALAILDSNLTAGLISKKTYRRQRGVLLTARALELETVDRDRARANVMEAVKLAPTLVPAAVLAAKFESETHQVRHAMKIVEVAWLANPHPDLADAYAHVKLGDSAQARLRRVEALAAKTPATKTPGHVEGALAIARAAIDAAEFARAREVLAPLINDPTQRVALLMAELERGEHSDSGRARAWTLRAVRARHDPAWTADGYVSDRWRPVSPVTGRLDAFHWQTPVASLPSDKGATIESAALEEGAFRDAPPASNPPKQITSVNTAPPEPLQEAVTSPVQTSADQASAGQASADRTPPDHQAPASDTAPAPEAVPAEPEPPEATTEASATEASPVATPLFRTRADFGGRTPLAPTIIPIVRQPDDPGIDDEGPRDEFAEQIGTPKAQAGGWRGFWSRLNG